jgi:hypothetical protein
LRERFDPWEGLVDTQLIKDELMLSPVFRSLYDAHDEYDAHEMEVL